MAPNPAPAHAVHRSRRRWLTVAAWTTGLGFPGAIAPLVPVRHWVLDLPASFAMQSGTALLLGAALFAAARRPRQALLWLTGLASATAAIAPPMQRAGTAAGVGPVHLRVLTMNLQRGAERRAEAMLATVADAAPDVLFLSEVTPAWWSSVAPTLLRTFPHHHERPDPGWFGVALWSRYPLRNAEDFGLPYEWAPAIRAVVEAPAGAVGVLGVHLPRPGLGGRCAERDAGLAAILPALPASPTRVVVCGDFNATPWNHGFRDLLAATGGRFRDAGAAGFAPTWPTTLPWPLRIPIDHILLSGDLHATEVRVLPDWGSDHHSLSAALTW